MSRNHRSKSEKNYKTIAFWGTPWGKFVSGIISVIIGFIINMSVQLKANSSAQQILERFFEEPKNVSLEGIEEVINGFFSPFSLNGMIFSLLWFFFGVVLADIFFPSESGKSFLKASEDNDDIIVNLLSHLTEQVYNRCSNSSEHCGGCSKFASEEDGLLRRYLYEESQHLQQAIIRSREGQYSLDSNIPKFHTFAITHMMETGGTQYSVVQWIGSKPYTNQNKYDETYDALDFDFLHTLLRKVTEPLGIANQAPYYERELREKQKFKIMWLLIGEIDCMKNNFDYIFYVVKQLSQDNRREMKDQIEIINQFFEFYFIDEETYRREISIILRNHNGNTCKQLFALESEPSLGIFGDQFMFVDSLDRASHGSIYTKKYAPDGAAQEKLLDASITVFGQILERAEKKDFSEVWKKYEEIVNQDNAWEEQLKSIWNQNKMGGGQ